MALSLAERDRMIDACCHAGVALVVGHCHSFDTPYLETRDLSRVGNLSGTRARMPATICTNARIDVATADSI